MAAIETQWILPTGSFVFDCIVMIVRIGGRASYYKQVAWIERLNMASGPSVSDEARYDGAFYSIRTIRAGCR